VLHTPSGTRLIPAEQGAYQDYYSQFASALKGESAFPVPAAEAIATLEVLDAARLSEATGSVVALPS
jgi:predicted dehydrogenase